MNDPTDPLARAAMLLALTGLPLSLCCGMVGAFPAVLAILLGTVAFGKLMLNPLRSGRGLALGAIVLGLVELAFGAAWFVLGVGVQLAELAAQ